MRVILLHLYSIDAGADDRIDDALQIKHQFIHDENENSNINTQLACGAKCCYEFKMPKFKIKCAARL